MALRGPQWENTFWNGTDDEGNDVVHINDRTTNAVRTRTRSVEDAEAEGGTQQGMLFHPATGTGLKDDPLVSPERRRSAIEKSYGLSDSPEDLAAQASAEQRFAATYKGRKALGNAEVKRNRELAIDAVDKSGLPIQVIENERLNHPQVVSTDRSVGHRGTGTYADRIHTAIAQNRVTEDWTRERVARATEGGDLVRNPKPLKVYDMYDDTAVHEIPGIPNEQELRDSLDGDDYTEDDMAAALAAARHPFKPDVGHEHVFTSPGDPTKFVSEHLGQGDRRGYQSGRGYVYENPDYYTRRKATAWEEEPTLVVEKKTKVRTPRPDVMAHELGHAYHLQGSDNDRGRTPNGVDPLLEGVADGFEDHYHRYKDYPVANISRSPYGRGDNRVFEDVESGENILDTSYSSQSSNWTNNTQRALYAAMRHVGAVTGKVPSPFYREDTVKSLGGEEPPKPVNNKTTIYMGVGSAENSRRQAEDQAGWEADNAAALEAHADWEERSGAKYPNRMALGRLLYDHPEALDLFRTDSYSKHVMGMQDAARHALADYKSRVDANGGGMDVDPTDPVHGWKASPARVEQHNEHVQGLTLPLVDPETGQQYDNRIKPPSSYDAHPDVFPAGGNPIKPNYRQPQRP